MKTAIELADEFPEQNPGNFEHDAALRLNDWGIEAHAMLRQQAEQIDSLKALVDNPRNTPFGKEAEKLADDWLAANAPGGWIDDLRNKCEALEITNDALKADAERFTTLAEYLVSDRTEYDDAIVDARAVEQLRAAIDAMKGKL